MPYFVYILYSEKDHKLYIGCTSDLEHRMIDHNQGKVDSTKHRRPVVLIYSERFEDKGQAFDRERFMKSLWSSRLKQKILKKYKQNRASY